MALVIDTGYIDVLNTTFDGVACYYVTAVYKDSLNPGSILCEPHSDTMCVHYSSDIPEKNEAQVRIFPNPVSDVLNIESDEPFTGIEVFNFVGESIYSQSFPGTNDITIPMKDRATGIYLLKIRSVKGIILRKVIKN